MKKNTVWTDLHELKALLIYKKLKAGGDRMRLCDSLSKDPLFIESGISPASINMKIGNIESLDPDSGNIGLISASTLNKIVWGKYKDTSIEELEQIIADKENFLYNLTKEEDIYKPELSYMSDNLTKEDICDRELSYMSDKVEESIKKHIEDFIDNVRGDVLEQAEITLKQILKIKEKDNNKKSA